VGGQSGAAGLTDRTEQASAAGHRGNRANHGNLQFMRNSEVSTVFAVSASNCGLATTKVATYGVVKLGIK
jgi:hypothetical protein